MSLSALNLLRRHPRSVHFWQKSLKYSENEYLHQSRRYVENNAFQRPGQINHAHLLNHSSNKIRYRVPKTWRKTFSLIYAKWKTDKKARRKSMMYSTIVTVVIFGGVLGYVEALVWLRPGGKGAEWRQSIWNQVANKDTENQVARLENESFTPYRKMFGLGETKPRMPTLEERVQQLPEEKYKTWNDIFTKGFPQTAAEYKRVSRMRPETLDDFEMMEEMHEKVMDPTPNSNAQLD